MKRVAFVMGYLAALVSRGRARYMPRTFGLAAQTIDPGVLRNIGAL